MPNQEEREPLKKGSSMLPYQSELRTYGCYAPPALGPNMGSPPGELNPHRGEPSTTGNDNARKKALVAQTPTFRGAVAGGSSEL